MSTACDCPLTRSGAHLDGCIYGRSPARAHDQAPCRFSVATDFGLTPRQAQAATLLGRGATNGEIARAMSIQLQGAKDLMSGLMARTHSRTRTEAALKMAGVLK